MGSEESSQKSLIGKEYTGPGLSHRAQYAFDMYQYHADESLQEMVDALRRLGALSYDMHSELVVQNEMTNELNSDASVSLSRFSEIDNRLQQLVVRSGWNRMKIIAFLSALLLILIAVIIYT